MTKEHELEENLERAYWRFDALHKAHYRDADPSRVGPMAEREAFKCVVRKMLADEREWCAKLCEANAEWANDPGRMPPEYRAGSVGASLGLAAEIRAAVPTGSNTSEGSNG